jgi:hypothetical protein
LRLVEAKVPLDLLEESLGLQVVLVERFLEPGDQLDLQVVLLERFLERGE